MSLFAMKNLSPIFRGNWRLAVPSGMSFGITHSDLPLNCFMADDIAPQPIVGKPKIFITYEK